MKNSMQSTEKRLLFFTFTILLSSFLVASVNARGGVFTIAPTKEVAEEVKPNVPDEVVGNVSVSNGSIDFYITSPSGKILFYSNKTTFETFKFTAKEENGTYLIHLLNPTQENITATLNYHINFVVVLQGAITITFSMGASTISTITSPFFDWVEFLKTILPYTPGL